MSDSASNPIIKAYQQKSFGTFDDAIDFTQIKIEHYLPAIEEGVRIARANINAIKENKNPANFENTILAQETSGELMELAAGIYYNLLSAEANDEHQALAKDISPKLAAFSSEVSHDEELFLKIKSVYENMANLGLNQEQKMLVEKTYKSFIRNGALLSHNDKEKLKNLDQELSVLAPKFSENVLKATNAFELWIENSTDIEGLPFSLMDAAAHEAEEKGQKGKWFFSLQAPSYIPFMQYCNNRDLRKKMFLAQSAKSFNDKFDNQEIVLKTVKLREQRAQLLGFKTHAEYVLQERMAETQDRVFNFIERITQPSIKAAHKDIAELKEYKKKLTGDDEFMPWDYSFYAEKLKEEKYHFHEEELRPFFKLEHVVHGAFDHAKLLFGLKFNKKENLPTYHPDVTVYEVTEESTGNYVGLFYTDFFPRPTKKNGAWATTYRDQGIMWGKIKRPHASIVCNFTKPTPNKPSLLTYDEVHTLFHEFGHALHMLLSNCTYRSLAGANVYWDFVELPSQIMENWVKEKEGLDLFARHFETQEPISAELVEKMNRSHQYQAGYFSLRQMTFAYLDMCWHSKPSDQITNVSEFEDKTTSHLRLFPKIEGTNSSCSFSHIFAGGYSAGYYSYKWAEVLDADAFEFFKEQGLFNKEIGESFKQNILSRGGSEHPMELYKKFRGREPDPNSVLRRDGLI